MPGRPLVCPDRRKREKNRRPLKLLLPKNKGKVLSYIYIHEVEFRELNNDKPFVWVFPAKRCVLMAFWLRGWLIRWTSRPCRRAHVYINVLRVLYTWLFYRILPSYTERFCFVEALCSLPCRGRYTHPSWRVDVAFYVRLISVLPLFYIYSLLFLFVGCIFFNLPIRFIHWLVCWVTYHAVSRFQLRVFTRMYLYGPITNARQLPLSI